MQIKGAMKKTFIYVVVALVPLALCLCTGLTTTKIGDINNNPRDYVGKEVVVSGEVTRRFTLFVVKYFALRDDSGEITVVTERPLPKQGEHLKLRGVVKEAFAIGSESLLVIQEKPEREK
jgi:hypothetical protein